MRDGTVPAVGWQIGPRNRWAYVHVGEVVKTVPVPRGGAVIELPRADTSLDLELPPYTDGLAVVRDGVLVHEAYGGEMHETSLHLSQSVAKSVLGLATRLADVDPGALVTDFVPEVAGSGYDGATVRHLLDMTAAVDFVEDYESFVAYDAACGWHAPIADAPRSILTFLPTIGPADWRHGERFHYASPNTDLLGLVVERAAGKPLAQVIADQLWTTIGAEHDAELAVDPEGTAVISGGFCASLRDYARLGLWVADHAEGLGTTPISDPTVPVSAQGYANQWWRRDGATCARGIHGQLIAVDSDTRTVLTILSSWPTAVDAKLDAGQRVLVRKLTR
ncbi:beta-lactamase family protein [Solirubrobacter phytolaccae]|uniref:Beta-lactamase family protein n=1 Tax=Solirubrobacter phytolaccae TaxID=1404360 RepID=A0A9X3N6E8_9ACTN|nr:serine hydrolase [Solirubrobacter phytolaccae]MDA0179295.1 beta-lactamase family protein [Solirubrobacter phytolaccae]